MTEAESNPLRIGIPPKSITFPDGHQHFILDDGLEENLDEPSDLFKMERKTIDAAEVLLREAVQIAKQSAEHQSMNGFAPLSAPRHSTITRQTAETKIELALNLDGSGRAEIATGIGFFDHMLTLLTRHSLIDLTVKAAGDLHVDGHHTVEDVGICYGKALVQCSATRQASAVTEMRPCRWMKRLSLARST